VSRHPDNVVAPAARARRSRTSGAGGTLLGVFIGMALGLALAAGVAFYLLRPGSAYQTSAAPAARDAKDPARASKSDAASADKPRFDFYKILPGGEEPKVVAKAPAPDRITAERALQPPAKSDAALAKADERAGASTATAKVPDRFWLQAGSFAGEADAENLKARLALAGWEASVQPADVAEKGTRFRVRLGPYDNTDELNRVKAELAKRGFDAAVIKY
jgi:cell division protein FtsN